MDIPLPSYFVAKETYRHLSSPPDVSPDTGSSLSPEEGTETLCPVWICPEVESSPRLRISLQVEDSGDRGSPSRCAPFRHSRRQPESWGSGGSWGDTPPNL